jgi:hypothetical protein
MIKYAMLDDNVETVKLGLAISLLYAEGYEQPARTRKLCPEQSLR